MNEYNYNQYNKLAQNTPLIDDSILNTPAKEEFNPQKVVTPDKSIETYLKMQQNQNNKTGNEVILDLDGKKTPVNSSEEFNTKYQSVQEMMGINDVKESPINSAAILLMLAIIVGLTIFIIINFKRSDYILKLEKEIDKLKDKNTL